MSARALDSAWARSVTACCAASWLCDSAVAASSACLCSLITCMSISGLSCHTICHVVPIRVQRRDADLAFQLSMTIFRIWAMGGDRIPSQHSPCLVPDAVY